MALNPETERLDTLLALALAFAQPRADGEGAQAPHTAKASGASPARRESSLLPEGLSLLHETDRATVERRMEWYARLGREKQARWLAHTLGRTRAKPPHLDQHVHPSHITDVLRREPVRIQALVLRHLPPAMATTCAPELNLPPDLLAVPDRAPEPRPPTKIVELVRQTFLAHFVAASDLSNPRYLDTLSGVELARLVRLVSVRETAVACRGIDRTEAVGSFLRRFTAEDARAIAAHIATLIQVEPTRVAFAHQLVQEALSLEPDPGAMLNRLGMRLLAIALVSREPIRVRYTAQKLPLEAARALHEMITDCRQRYDREMMRIIAREAEAVAVQLRRAEMAAQDGAASASDSENQTLHASTASPA